MIVPLILTIDYVRNIKDIIIRGLRVDSSEYEFQLAGMNKKLDNNIETVF